MLNEIKNFLRSVDEEEANTIEDSDTQTIEEETSLLLGESKANRYADYRNLI